MRVTISVLGAFLLSAAGLMALAADPQAPAVKVEGKPEAAVSKTVDKPPAAPVSPEVAKAEEPIRAFVKSFVGAYNTEKTDDLVAQFDDDAIVVDSDGNETKGKEAIKAMYVEAFEETEGLKIEAEIEGIKFVTPDVVRVDGRSTLSNTKEEGLEFSRFSALLVNRAGKWKTAELRDYPIDDEDDILPAERLKELEWMVGDWVDESDNNRVSSSIHWNEGKSFLVRTYHVELEGVKASSGTMFIGWSPQTQQIKSWLFDSEGGHGEGIWTRANDNTWVVKAHGVLRDGSPTSATQIHVLINKDAVKTSSVDRIIGGEVAPDISDIMMVRKAPAPSTTIKPAEKPAAK